MEVSDHCLKNGGSVEDAMRIAAQKGFEWFVNSFIEHLWQLLQKRSKITTILNLLLINHWIFIATIQTTANCSSISIIFLIVPLRFWTMLLLYFKVEPIFTEIFGKENNQKKHLPDGLIFICYFIVWNTKYFYFLIFRGSELFNTLMRTPKAIKRTRN